MDSLQVTNNTSSKSSSRSASPSRPLPTRTNNTTAQSNNNNNNVAAVRREVMQTPRTRREQQQQPTTPRLPTGGSSQETIPNNEEETECNLTPVVGNGSSELLEEDTPDGSRSTNPIYDRLLEKMNRVKHLITEEQNSRDENVNEYLKLAASADKQQLLRIKAVFEKKNQKSAQTIAGLQRKLESYTRKLRDIESSTSHGGSSKGSDSSVGHHRQPREMLRDMGQGLKNVGGNIRDGITGFSGTVMSKPREFAHLIKNKFGSADNINTMGKSNFYTGIEESGGSEEDQQSQRDRGEHHRHRHHGGSLPRTARYPGAQHGSEEGASECSSATSESLPNQSNSQPANTVISPCRVEINSSHSSTGFEKHLYEEIREFRNEFARLRDEIDSLKTNMHAEQQFTTQVLLDEKFRLERLEEQLNDLTELHQTEVENLKTHISDSEEKVQYQSEERLRDIHEMLEACQTKISKMEHQQNQHQQYVTLEGINNSNARALVVKLINVVLTVLQVVLLLVATTAGIVMPFLKTRLRVLSTILLIAGIVFVVKQWPEVRDVGDHLMKRMKQALAVN